MNKAQVLQYFENDLLGYFCYDENSNTNAKLFGSLAQKLGIEKCAPSDVFKSVLDNKHPVTKAKLRPRECKRQIFSACMSAPKAFSILAVYMLGKDNNFMTIHEEAADEAMSWIEEKAKVRIRKNGANDSAFTGSFLGVKITHLLSRADDPQLHSHYEIFNLTYDQNEQKYKALDPLEIYKESQEATLIYRQKLVERLKDKGIKASLDAKGEVLIAGIPQSLCDKFSKRSKQIKSKAKELQAKNPNKKYGKRAIARIANLFKEPKRPDSMTKAALRRIREEIKIACGEQITKVARGMIGKTPQKNPAPKGINTKQKVLQTFQNLFGKIKNWTTRLWGWTDSNPPLHTELRNEFTKASARTFNLFSSDIEIHDARYQNMYSEQSAVFEVNDDGGASFTKNLNHFVDAKKVPDEKVPIVYLNASRKRIRRNFNVITTPFAEIGKIKSRSIFILDNADFIGCEYFLKLIKVANETSSKIVLISNDQTTRLPKEDDALPLLRSFGLKKIIVKNQITNTLPKPLPQTSARTQSDQTIPIPQRTQQQRQLTPHVSQPDKTKTPIQTKTTLTPISAQSQLRRVSIPISRLNHTPPTQPDTPSKQQPPSSQLHTQPHSSQLPSTLERQIVNRPAEMNKSSSPTQNNPQIPRPISTTPSIYNRAQPRQTASAIPAHRTPQQKQPPQSHPQYVRPTLNPQPKIAQPSTTNYPKPQQNTYPKDNSAPTKVMPPTNPEPPEEPPRQTIRWDIDL